MIKMSHVLTALLFASISVAHAETAKQPVSQGEASVEKNLDKNASKGHADKGLTTADTKLEANEAKIAAKRAAADKTASDAKLKKDKEQKPERMEKRDHDKMERPEKMERPAKIERPGK